jgi:hypothetical protein
MHIIDRNNTESASAVSCQPREIAAMLFILYYLVAIVILVLHFTGVLARYNLEWLVLALAVTVFPAVIYL